MQSVAAVILGAGESSRFGSPKQLAQFRGKSFVRQMVDSARDAGCLPVVLVVGSRAAKIEAEVPPGVIVVKNENWQAGIGTSVRSGVQHLIEIDAKVDAVLLLVCDQPFVDANVIRTLIAEGRKTGKDIIASSYSDTLGVPALFARPLFPELLTLDGDAGAKKIILASLDRVAEFQFPEGKIDIDFPADYEAAEIA